jgi:hypothetical protein
VRFEGVRMEWEVEGVDGKGRGDESQLEFGNL